MPPLDEYRRKRDAAHTPEPVPGSDETLPTGDNDLFVIQEHHARRLHWDVRLERDGVLVSWAVPKGLPAEPGTIRLAVHTEDHPMEYATFEGEIPKGEYGAGKMTIWDRGRYETIKWSDREVAVVLHGQRVSGTYVFFRASRSGNTGNDKDWMVRRSDPPTNPSWEALPEQLAPMLATAGSLPSTEDDEHWAYEFKWDGVRALARVEGGRLQLASRNGNDITITYPELRALGQALGGTQVLLDGEIVAMAEGRPNFGTLQRRMHVGNETQARRLASDIPVTYLMFDLLHLDGRSCLSLPYSDRRELLEDLDLAGPHWQTSPSFVAAGAAVLQASREQGLEGVIAKRLTSRYHPGRRSPDWIKITDLQAIGVVIGGWRPGEGRRASTFGSLLLGRPVKGGLHYVGQVGTGFTDQMLDVLMAKLKPLEHDTSPFVNEIPRDRARGARWVRPELVGEVVFKIWTADGRMRAPSWRGLRPDLDPEDL